MKPARWAAVTAVTLLWTVGASAAPTREQAIRAVLANAEVHGLRASDYTDPDLHQALARYIADLRDGRQNPWTFRSPEAPESVDVAVEQILAADDLDAALRLIEPPYPEYRRIMLALEFYRAAAAHDDGARFPAVDKPLDPGQAWEGVPRLARLLATVGDLNPYAPVPATYDGVLVEAVKRFQSRHGLEPDGRIGKGTLLALNVPMRNRVRQLELTLERLRWLPRDFDQPMILVNIPEYKLRALDASHRLALELNVVVGSPKTPTPELRGSMTHLFFRPYWTVPWSIQKNELIPEIERNRNYLTKHSYEVITHQREVVTNGEVSDEVLAGLKSGKYMIRQTPGGANALGMVKLMFPNTEAVYLHDTPSKSFFARSSRDLSHGCVRVQDVPELVAWVFRDREDWTRERISEAFKGEDNQRVNLEQAIPVFLVYQTASVADDGIVRFFEDIYGRDAAVVSSVR